MEYSILLAPLLLGFGYRARGGGIKLGEEETDLARFLFWGLPVGLVCTIIAHTWHLPLWLGAVCIVSGFLSAKIGHSSEQNNDTEENIMMGFITTMMLALILLPFIIYSLLQGNQHLMGMLGIALLFGVLGAPAYLIGWRTPFALSIGGKVWCQARSAEWGELLIGVLPFGVGLTVLGLLGLMGYLS